MTDQSKILVGSKITTRKEYPACIVDGVTVYGYLPAGATGKVINHTADGRAMVLFGDEIHTFEDLGALTVEMPQPAEAVPVWTDTPGVWTNLQIANALMDAIWPDDGDDDKPLKHAIIDAERVCRRMRDEMAAQLAVAQERIRQLEASRGVEPDWGKSPAWAQFWAVDADGVAYWHEVEPNAKGVMGYWGKGAGRCEIDPIRRSFNWLDTLCRRPQIAGEES